jgi:hypothetical protein
VPDPIAHEADAPFFDQPTWKPFTGVEEFSRFGDGEQPVLGSNRAGSLLVTLPPVLPKVR